LLNKITEVVGAFDGLVFFGKDLTNLEWEALKTFLTDNKGVVLTILKDKMLLFVNAEVINVRKSIYETFFKHTELRKVATLLEETDMFYKSKLRSPDVVALYEASLIAYLLGAFTPAGQDATQTSHENVQQVEQPKQESEQVKQTKTQTTKQAEQKSPTKQPKVSKQQEAAKPDKVQKQSKMKEQPETVAEKQKKTAKQTKEQSEKTPQKSSQPIKQREDTQPAKKSKTKKEREVA
jgi:flagellar biosynthesis GTPase FlhF